jgi:hypothetical protein
MVRNIADRWRDRCFIRRFSIFFPIEKSPICQSKAKVEAWPGLTASKAALKTQLIRGKTGAPCGIRTHGPRIYQPALSFPSEHWTANLVTRCREITTLCEPGSGWVDQRLIQGLESVVDLPSLLLGTFPGTVPPHSHRI